MVERIRVVAPEGGRVMTKQSMALETDVNHILARWIHHGTPPNGNGSAPRYGDFSNFDSYHAALDLVMEAQSEFGRLPAHVRDHVDNDPGKFLDMVFDPGRRDELVALKLAPELVPEAARAAPVAEPEADPAP